VKLAPDFELLSRIPRSFDILQTMGEHAVGHGPLSTSIWPIGSPPKLPPALRSRN
jgi:hypothetical protein